MTTTTNPKKNSKNKNQFQLVIFPFLLNHHKRIHGPLYILDFLTQLFLSIAS